MSAHAVMYAYIRFRDDNHRAVVETTDFRNFSPKHKDDFENRWYEVFWQDEDQSGYFKAQVVRLYASREDAEKRGKRVPIPPPPSDSDSDTGSSDEWQPKAVKKPMCSMLQEERFKKRNMELLRARDQTELQELREENKRLHHRIEMLEKALCSKIFETEQMRCKKAATPPEKNRLLECQTVRPRVQTTPEKSRDEFSDEVLVPPSPDNGTVKCIERAPEEGNLVPFATVGTEVFLGNGVKISKATFSHLMSRPKDSIFVREASVAIFSTAGLLGRSVTGSVSNRTKTDPKPALDNLKYEALSGMCQFCAFH
uniref:BEN domain-containing protein n=1 Tax=Rhipicephalus pulchellus TaxID=72859 RepID=L7M1I6_RHIPC